MKKIITAIGNNIINKKLKYSDNYEILGQDIQYKEGIIEFLSKEKNVDILIMSEILEGEIEFKKLISEILKINEKIEIIVFIEKENKELKNYLYDKGIYKIYKNNELSIEELKEMLESENSRNTQEMAEEIRKLKQIIIEQNCKVNNELEKGKIIAITGNNGVGKSTLTCAICKQFSKLKKKTVIIDFDTYNRSIPVLYNKFSNNIDYKNIKNNIIKYSTYENLLYVEEEFLESYDFIDKIKDLIEEFDYVLIDTSSNIKSRFYKEILEISDDIIFIIEPTLCNLKKAINMFEILKMDFDIQIRKVKLIINKKNNYSVDSFIIQKIFGVKKIVAEVKYQESLESFINGKRKIKIKL